MMLPFIDFFEGVVLFFFDDIGLRCQIESVYGSILALGPYFAHVFFSFCTHQPSNKGTALNYVAYLLYLW